MPEPPLLLVLLAIISVSTLAMAAAMIVTAVDVRRAVRRLDALAPTCGHALREVHHVLRQSRRLLVRAHEVGDHVEGAVHVMCAAVSDVTEQWSRLKARAGSLFQNGFGHPARSGPRWRKQG